MKSGKGKNQIQMTLLLLSDNKKANFHDKKRKNIKIIAKKDKTISKYTYKIRKI